MKPTARQKMLLAKCEKEPKSDVLWKLADLYKQATVERSHYYTGRVILEAIEEIASFRMNNGDLI